MKDFYSYPNPVKSTLNIVFGETPFLKTTCFIYNNPGELVKKESVNNINGNGIINFSNLQIGLYFVNFPEIGKVFRIIKE